MSRGDRAAGGGALVLLIALFLPWFRIQTGSTVVDQIVSDAAGTLNAFKMFDVVDIVLLLGAVAVAAVVFLMANGNLDDQLRSAFETVGGIITVIVVWNVIDNGATALFTVAYGAYLAIAGAFAIAVGGYLNRTDGV